MPEEVITTGVDQLIAYLKGKEKAPLLETAKALGVSVETLQSWVDFLVEEGILGIEYQFTKPYIYLNKEEEEKGTIVDDEELSWDAFHQAFLDKAAEKEIPPLKAATLWKNYALQKVEEKKEFFYDEARKRGFSQIDELWKTYKTEVLLKL